MMKDSSETIILPENERMSPEKGPFLFQEVSSSNLSFFSWEKYLPTMVRPRYPRQRFKIHLNPWMYRWGVGDDVSWLVANFLRSFKYFWRNHKGSKIVKAISNTKKRSFLPNRKVYTRANPTIFLSQTKQHKNRSPTFFLDSWTLGFTFSDTNTNKKRPWGDHEIMARIHPTWRSHLCSLLGCRFNGLGAPWAVAFSGLGWMGWMSCCVGLYPKLPRLVMEVPGFAYPTS